MEFKIKRSEWLHGEGANRSYLHRVKDDKKCCVGFYLEALGVDPYYLKMSRHVSAVGLGNNLPSAALWMKESNFGISENSRVAVELYEANDRVRLSEEKRESTIKDLFSKNGVTVVFED